MSDSAPPASPRLDGGTSRHSIIESIGVYLPPTVTSTREVLGGCVDVFWSPQDRAAGIERLTGIRNRRVAHDDEACTDLAKQAIAKCLAVSRYEPRDIDLLISCSISRYHRPYRCTWEPSASAYLAGECGFVNALAFDVANGCGGMFTAIKVVDALIKAGVIRAGMVVSGEHITDLMKTAQREVSGYSDPRLACLTLGDAGVALILKEATDDGVGFHAIELYTAARYSNYCVARPTDREHGGVIMLTESVKLFQTAISHAAADVTRVLDKLRWPGYAPDHVIIHQTGQTAIHEATRQTNDLMRRELFHPRNMINNVGERGNTATTSHFVAMWDGIVRGTMNSGDEILFAAQGSGLTIGTAPYTLDDLPDRVRDVEARAEPAPSRAGGGGLTRAAVKASIPRIRIESLGVADGIEGPGAGLQLVRAAIARCVGASSHAPEDVGVLMYAGVYRDDWVGEPAIAALIAADANLNDTGISPAGKKTLAFDVCNGALGFLDACYVGAGMIRSGDIEVAMVVASEVENNRGIPGETLLGIAEVGSAIILDRSPEGTPGFGDAVFMSFAEYRDAFSSHLVHSGGRARLSFERRADLEAVYLKCIVPAVSELLGNAALRMEDIAVILPPQISVGFVSGLASTLNVSRDKVFAVVEDGRDLSSSALAYSLRHVHERGVIRSGDIGLIINVASGVQVGAALYYF